MKTLTVDAAGAITITEAIVDGAQKPVVTATQNNAPQQRVWTFAPGSIDPRLSPIALVELQFAADIASGALVIPTALLS